MNEKPLTALLGLLLLLVAACSGGGGEAPPLEGARLGGTFSLIDQDGRRLSSDRFDRRYRIVYFGFTYCPDVCPLDLQTIGHAMRMVEKSEPGKAARIQPIFITVDPERDTPAVVKQYVSSFHPRLIGLTGSAQEIAAVAKQHGVYFKKADDPGASEYRVDHSRIALLFGPKGEPIAILPHDQGAEAVAGELRRWVR